MLCVAAQPVTFESAGKIILYCGINPRGSEEVWVLSDRDACGIIDYRIFPCCCLAGRGSCDQAVAEQSATTDAEQK